MPKEKKPSFTLNVADDMFTTQAVRDERKMPKIQEIPLRAIKDFPDHPYKVKDDEDMYHLMESIAENGVLTPVTLRKLPGGTFEMISGHRRKRACELLGIPTIRAEVLSLDRDQAIIMMCDSTLQRTTILPSEKAFAYKMRLEAMKRQGKRTDLTSSPLATELGMGRADVELGKLVGEGKDNIRRYIRLTELVPELLEFVDEGRIALRPAVELSYLPEDFQRDLVDIMDFEDCTPSHTQTLRMRRMLAEGMLTTESLTAIMQEVKPNQKDKLVLRDERITNLLPRNLPVNQREDYVVKALEHYGRFLKRQNERDER